MSVALDLMTDHKTFNELRSLSKRIAQRANRALVFAERLQTKKVRDNLNEIKSLVNEFSSYYEWYNQDNPTPRR